MVSKAYVDRLKGHFRKAQNLGGKSLVKGKNLIVKNPIQSALFTVLAANIIKRTKSRKD